MNLYNKNSGYGQYRIPMLELIGTGKMRVVGKDGLENLQTIKEIFNVDPEGEVRHFSTISNALDDCVDDENDVIFVLPNHTETVTSKIDVNVSGVTILGIGQGDAVPKVTGNGTIDAIDVSSANVTIQNIQFGAPETDAQTSFINVDAANCTINDIKGIGSQAAKNVVDCITVTANADDLTIDGVEFHNSTVQVNSFLSFEGEATRVAVKNFFAFGNVSTGGIIDGATISHLYLKNVNVGVVGSTKPAATLDSNPTGMAVDCNFAGTSTTLANNAALGTGLRMFNVRVLEETDGSAQGALIPAVDTE